MSVVVLKPATSGSAFSQTDLAVPNAFVIRGREQENTSTFADDEWNYSCAVGQRKSQYYKSINFNNYEIEYRDFIKECIYFFSRRMFIVDGGRGKLSPVAPSSWRFAASIMVSLLRSVSTSNRRLDEVDQEFLDHYMASHSKSKPHHRIKVRSLIRRLYLCADNFSFAVFQFDPWDGTPATRLEPELDHANREQKTPRIPAAVMRPLLQWSMFYLDTAKSDIEKLWAVDEQRSENGKYMTQSVPATTVFLTNLDKNVNRLRSYLARMASAGVGLPCEGERPCRSEISIFSGVSVGALYSKPLVALMDEHVRQYGRSEQGASFRWSNLPGTNVPWRCGIREVAEWRSEVRLLYAAAFIVISYLSGMRAVEVLHLRVGCLTSTSQDDGKPPRIKLKSKAFKGQPPGGVDREWVVTEPVVEAVEVLEWLLSRDKISVPDQYLFSRVYGKAKTTEIMSSTTIAKAVKDFLHAIQQHAASAIENADQDEREAIRERWIVPEEHTRWNLQLRQFRRTLAWFIAKQPFGVVAGMIQYGHASEVMFQGYAGELESDFPGELEAATLESNMEDVVAAYEDYTKLGIVPAGAGAVGMVAFFNDVRREVGDFEGAVVDKARRDRMLKNKAVLLFPGMFNNCFFQRETAACLARSKRHDIAKPLFAHCDPLKCGNSLITRLHVPTLETARAEVVEMMQVQGLSVIQKTILKRENARLTAMIDGVQKHGSRI